MTGSASSGSSVASPSTTTVLPVGIPPSAGAFTVAKMYSLPLTRATASNVSPACPGVTTKCSTSASVSDVLPEQSSRTALETTASETFTSPVRRSTVAFSIDTAAFSFETQRKITPSSFARRSVVSRISSAEKRCLNCRLTALSPFLIPHVTA